MLRQPGAAASLACVECQYCLCAMPILLFHTTLKARGCLGLHDLNLQHEKQGKTSLRATNTTKGA